MRCAAAWEAFPNLPSRHQMNWERGRIRISGGADGAGRGRGAGRRRRHCHHAVLGADFSGIETCTNLRSARNWARLTATGERYMKASSILETIGDTPHIRSEEHTSELQSLMRISYAVFCLKKKKK